MTNTDFTEAVMAMAGPQRPFQPQAIFIPEGDCIEVLIAPDNYFAQRLTDLVTVYRSRQTGGVVGVLVEGVGISQQQRDDHVSIQA